MGVSITEATCWTVIRGAAAGEDGQRSEFTRRYESVIRAYFGARWRGSAMTRELEDAVEAMMASLRELPDDHHQIVEAIDRQLLGDHDEQNGK